MNKKSKKLVALLLCVATMLSVLAGCGGASTNAGSTAAKPAPSATPAAPAAPSEPKYKEEIVVALAGEFTTLDAAAGTAINNQIVQDCTHDLLFDVNLNTGKFEGELVESWEVIELDHWRFKLKDGIKFHDGTTLNTDDVEFTFKRDAEMGATAGYMAKIKEFIKVDDLTFELKLVQPDVDFYYTFGQQALAIMSKEAFESMPEEEAVNIGTGPWKFDKFVAGDYISLVRNEESTLYDVPNTKRLVFRTIPEAASRMIALENEEVDIILDPSSTDYTRLSEDNSLQMVTGSSCNLAYLGFNIKSPNTLMANVKFREAIACAIDKEELVIAAFDGYAEPSTSIMCREQEYYADIDGISYNPERAQELFNEIGEITISVTASENGFRKKLAENFQAQMAKYNGVKVNLNVMQHTAYLSKLKEDPKTSGVELFMATYAPNMNADAIFRAPLYTNGGNNRSHFSSAEVDALIDAGIAETDSSKRAEIYRQLQEKVTCEYIPWVPLAQPVSALGASADVTGFMLHPGNVHQFKNAEVLIG